MFRFTLFGVPVEIQPWFWLTTAYMGRAMDARTPADFLNVLLFIVVAMISILVHEFGHALVGRRLGGGRASIVLWAMGGLATNQGGRFTRSGNFWRVAAGPGAGLLLFLIVFAGLCITYTPRGGLGLMKWLVFNKLDIDLFTPAALELAISHLPRLEIIHDLLWVNFWWSLLNLLPVLPLDGGRIADLFIKPQRRVYQICVITAIAVAVFGISRHQPYMAMMFGYFAFQNYQAMQGTRWI